MTYHSFGLSAAMTTRIYIIVNPEEVGEYYLVNNIAYLSRSDALEDILELERVSYLEDSLQIVELETKE